MKRYFILITLIVLSSVPLIISIASNEKDNKLINEVYDIKNIIKTDIQDKSIINNTDYDINGNGLFVNIKAKGIAFVDNDKKLTIIVESDNSCAYYKEILTNDVIIRREKCNNYKLISNAIMKIVESKDGLYYQDGKYIFKGSNVDNYVKYNDKLYQIISLNESIKMVEYESSLYSKYSDSISLTIEDIKLSSLTYIERDNYIITDTYMNKVSSWIKSDDELGYYIYTDGNIYRDSKEIEKNIRNVIELKDVILVNGIGTLNYPYIIKEV